MFNPSSGSIPMIEAPVGPLRRRMVEDMTVRKFAPRTQKGYIRAVKGFSAFLGASPDRASFEDLRRYQLHLVARGAGVPTINHTVTALRFLFTVTLRKPHVVARLPFVRESRKLPVVLTPEEVARLLDAAPGLKYKAALKDDASRTIRYTGILTSPLAQAKLPAISASVDRERRRGRNLKMRSRSSGM
jgi:integrase/recombinase XerD